MSYNHELNDTILNSATRVYLEPWYKNHNIPPKWVQLMFCELGIGILLSSFVWMSLPSCKCLSSSSGGENPLKKGPLLSETEYMHYRYLGKKLDNTGFLQGYQGLVNFGWVLIDNIFTFWCKMSFFNPSLAKHDMSCLSKQCRSRSVGFWRSQLIWICTVCHLICEFLSKTGIM